MSGDLLASLLSLHSRSPDSTIQRLNDGNDALDPLASLLLRHPMSDQGAPGWHPPPADGWLPGGAGSGDGVLAPQGWQQPSRPPPPPAHASPPPPVYSQAGSLSASHRGGLVGTTTGQGFEFEPLSPQQVQQQQLSQQSAYSQAQLYHPPRAIASWPAASPNAVASGSRSSPGSSGRGYLAFSSPGESTWNGLGVASRLASILPPLSLCSCLLSRPSSLSPLFLSLSPSRTSFSRLSFSSSGTRVTIAPLETPPNLARRAGRVRHASHGAGRA